VEQELAAETKKRRKEMTEVERKSREKTADNPPPHRFTMLWGPTM
jgi:hypothetical protein